MFEEPTIRQSRAFAERLGLPLAGALVLVVLASPASGQGEKVSLPFQVAAFDRVFNSAARAGKFTLSAKQTQCLDPRPDAKRAVCSYGLGFMTAMAMGGSRTAGAEELTMICTPKEQGADQIKCLASYTIAMQVVSPQLSKDQRSNLLSGLIKGIEVGEEVRIDVAGIRYILQNVGPAGIWFHAQVREE